MNEEFIVAAFIGFQMGAGGNKSFGQYIRSMNLIKESVQSTNDNTESTMNLSRMGIVPKKGAQN